MLRYYSNPPTWRGWGSSCYEAGLPAVFSQCRSWKGWNFTSPQVFQSFRHLLASLLDVELSMENPHKAVVHGPQCLPVFSTKKTPRVCFMSWTPATREKLAFASLIWANLAEKHFSTCFTSCPRRIIRCSWVVSDNVVLQYVAIITVCELSKDCWDFFTFLGHVKGHICCLPKKNHYWRAHSWLEIPKGNAFQEVRFLIY